MSRYDDLSPRAQWWLQNLDELDLAEECAAFEAKLERVRVIEPKSLGGLNDLGRAQANGWNAALAAVREVLAPPADTLPDTKEA
ncbi:hypothetical protein GCM10010348_79130 [Streptomyces anthocyanicus]|uniref:hypothetical protein n=1 Tax=Streptomyces TaxID=1883 RepID=UPI001873FF7F|nr:hypothetical protein [Streptomyces anthocyanicus]WTC12503.1 hypothetical protein OHA15_33695 [Streptomyces anthocyanicus]GHC39984.1 hypothetical protein GCM10010348_79130 [Streptomyces anthocyanicus]